LEQDEQRLVKRFSNLGYPYVRVKPELMVREIAGTVDINWQVETGPKCTFGQVTVKGNEMVSTSLILNQLAFTTDQQFQQVLVDTSQQHIYQLGMFQFVTVKGILSETKQPVIPVRIVVKESPRTSALFGPGYGSEEKFRFYLELRKLGFTGGARRIALNFRYSAIEPININLLFTQPAFIAQQSILQLNPFLKHQKEPGYTVERFGGSVTYGQKLKRFLDASLTYTYEKVIERDISEIVDTLDVYKKSSITFGFTWDNSNPVFTPQRGWYVGFSFKVNGLFLGRQFKYAKPLIDLRRYQVVADMVLAYRIKVGTIVSYAKDTLIPVEDRFYSGGSNSVRGWSRSLLGPLDDEGIPVGGNSLLESSVELRYPIMGSFAGVVFTDFGNVWKNSLTCKINELRYSVGLGLRYNTMIGPIRLDIARPIFDTEKKIQWHFSIGHAY